MNNISKILFVIFFIALFPAITIAQEPSKLAAAVVAGTEEVQLLKTQIKMIEGYENQFISIILWSLSAVIAMALGLSAFNWYTSKTSYERDVQSLRQENKALKAELLARLKSETDVASKSLSKGLSDRQAEIEVVVTKNLNAKLAIQSSQLAGHKQEILELRYSITKKEAEEAIESKDYSQGIYTYCKLLEITVQKNIVYQVNEILDEIGVILDKIETSLSSYYVTEIVESLRRLPEKYQTVVENIILKVNKAQK
ncbi:MAG: hypothetical protein GY737_16255 [Desulfobacteraceae bacterium]|nr:hypothetical protein [Desulfobacteraceae bacterium]